MIGPEDLHDLLHEHAATIEPIPHLAELGASLTVVERHRRSRAVVSTTLVAFAVAAAVTAVRAVETRPSHIDTAPATQRVVIAPAPQVTPTTAPAVATTVPPTTAAPTTAAPPATAAPAVTPPPVTTAAPTPTTAPAPAAPATAHGTPARTLTFRAASVSDLSSADPPAADYFGVAPPGSTVTAASQYGNASAQAGADGRWSLHVALPGAPLGQRFRVVLSAPPLPSLTFNFTHTAG